MVRIIIIRYVLSPDIINFEGFSLVHRQKVTSWLNQNKNIERRKACVRRPAKKDGKNITERRQSSESPTHPRLRMHPTPQTLSKTPLRQSDPTKSLISALQKRWLWNKIL